jgi:glucuronosyltransferase
MDEAPGGVLYFSLGTMIRSESLPPETLRAFIEAFTQLPFRVLWKCNVDKMAAVPINVLIRSWLPQKDILGNNSF